MTQQTIDNGEAGLSVRTKINENFTELYAQTAAEPYVSVNAHADLPAASGSGEVYLVRTSSGFWPVRRPAGLWRDSGSWEWLGNFTWTAEELVNVPGGGLSATTVQGAINELDADITAITDALPTDIRAQTEAALVEGANITITPSGSGATRQLTIAATGGGGSDPLDLTEDAPATPPAGTVRLFRREIAGRQMPAFIGPSGLGSALQPFIAQKKIGFWNPAGNAIVPPGVFGITAFTATGTATARHVAATNLFTRMRRLGYVSAATAGALAGARVANAQFTTGNGAGLGGFTFVYRFGYSIITANMRAFVGCQNTTGPSTNVEPSTIIHCCGVGRRAADTTLHIFHGGTAAQTPIDLGADFPANTANVDFYELALFSPRGETGVVNWQVTRLNTGHVASGQISGGAAVISASTVMLTANNSYVTNNTTAAAVGIDISSVYTETET